MTPDDLPTVQATDIVEAAEIVTQAIQHDRKVTAIPVPRDWEILGLNVLSVGDSTAPEPAFCITIMVETGPGKDTLDTHELVRGLIGLAEGIARDMVEDAEPGEVPHNAFTCVMRKMLERFIATGTLTATDATLDSTRVADVGELRARLTEEGVIRPRPTAGPTPQSFDDLLDATQTEDPNT